MEFHTVKLAQQLEAIKKYIPVRDSVKQQIQQHQEAQVEFTEGKEQLFRLSFKGRGRILPSSWSSRWVDKSPCLDFALKPGHLMGQVLSKVGVLLKLHVQVFVHVHTLALNTIDMCFMDIFQL
jgi:hypothetical protein